MYLLIGIIVALHALSTFINWDAAIAEERPIAAPIITGAAFGLFSVLGWKIASVIREKMRFGWSGNVSKRRKLTAAEKKEDLLGTLMASLPFLGFVLFVLIPTVVSLIMSFYELHSYDISRAEFVGFQNFITLISHEPSGSTYVPSMVNKAFVNTLTYCLSVPIRLVITVFIANLMAKPIARCVNSTVRVILFLPSLCSSVGVTLMWQWILQDQYGIVNIALKAIGIGNIGFMTDPNWFWFSVILMVIWMRATNIVNLQSALANVSISLYEAAKIDGANKRQLFWNITIPAITPTLFYVVTMDLIAALQESGIMQFVTTNGVGPDFKAVTLSYYIYRMAFTSTATDGMGLGCAMALMLAVFIITLNRLNFRLGDRWVCYDD